MAQTLISNSMQITKLNSENYSNWKFKVQMILMRDGLDDIVNNPPPTVPDEAFLKKDKQARAIINLSIDDSQIGYIRNETTSYSTWQKLKSIHERSNLSSKLYLLRKLYSMKMPEHGNMISHITHMIDLVEKLKAIGENIPEQHVAALLLVSIPESYNNLITAIEARDETSITSDLVKTKLIDEYNRRIEQQSERSSNTIPTAYKSSVNLRNFNKKSEKFCTYCKYKNHTRDECFRLQNKNCSRNSNNGYSGKSDPRVSKHGGKTAPHCMSADVDFDSFESARQCLSSDARNEQIKIESLQVNSDLDNLNVFIIDSGGNMPPHIQ